MHKPEGGKWDNPPGCSENQACSILSLIKERPPSSRASAQQSERSSPFFLFLRESLERKKSNQIFFFCFFVRQANNQTKSW